MQNYTRTREFRRLKPRTRQRLLPLGWLKFTIRLRYTNPIWIELEVRMAPETVSVEWQHDQVFLLRDRNGFPIVMTQPDGVNGADLLPLSVIGCAVWDVIAILRKQRQQVTALGVTAESLRDEQPPWRFRKITIRYRIRGRGLNQQRIQRAIELSQSRYCSTYATLRDAVELVSEFEILPDENG